MQHGQQQQREKRHQLDCALDAIRQRYGNLSVVRGIVLAEPNIAKVDPNAIGCGSTVTNIMIDEQLIKNDDHFEKTVDLFETYFKNGGVHFQLTYVSREDLICAKQTPDDYQNLRVRVTGFSDYFTRLQESMQDDIIERMK